MVISLITSMFMVNEFLSHEFRHGLQIAGINYLLDELMHNGFVVIRYRPLHHIASRLPHLPFQDAGWGNAHHKVA